MSDARQRRVSSRVWASVSALSVLAIAFMLNYLAFRHYERWDWTVHGLYTLSPRTIAVLHELDHDVDLWIVLSEGEPQYRELRNLIERYGSQTTHLRVHYVDPDRDPGAYRDLRRRFGLGMAAIGDTAASDVAAVVADGDRHWEISRDDLLRTTHSATGDEEGEVELDVESERALTGSLVELTTGHPTKLCITRGHGEFSVDGEERSLVFFRDEMRRENLQLEAIDTRGRNRISHECDVVAMIGPQTQVPEEEVELLRAYLRSGGNLLLAFDPVLENAQRSVQPTGLESMLRDFGVGLDANVVVEPARELWPADIGHPLGPYFVADLPEHAITRHLRGEPLITPGARSVRPLNEERVHVLAQTSPASYGESDVAALEDALSGAEALEPGPGDLHGPVPIAVATQVEVTGRSTEEQERPGGRLVVIGTAGIFDGQLMAVPIVVNRLFVSSSVGWLARRQALSEVPPRSFRQRPVSMTEADTNTLLLRVVVVIPLAFVFLGVAAWWSRRR